MWTPRRVALLLAGIVLFGGAYFAYAHFLGWLDGLPQLPARYATPAKDQPPAPVRLESPTEDRIREAFGANSPEVQNRRAYLNRLEFRNGESSVVLVSGPAQIPEGSKTATFAPFSLAVFGKPPTPAALAAGEVPEVTTFHADRAVLEFDKVLGGPSDMGTTNLLRIELVSEPNPDVTGPDPRRGLVHIVHNQRSADPNRALVVRTPGPVFYRDPKGVGPKPDAGPDIWADTAVEIVDRQNLPRPYGSPAPPTAPAGGDDLRAPGAVPKILAGMRLPPPTITAVGLRVYLDEAKPAGKDAPARKAGGFAGVKRVELLEKVLFNLWVDAKQGFVTTSVGPAAAGATASPLAPADLPDAAGAVLGPGLLHLNRQRRLDRALLQIDTNGPFAYHADPAKPVARFDVVPAADPHLPNDVQVTRIPPRGGRQRLFSQVLEIEFDAPPVGPPADKKAVAAPGPTGPGFKRLHAWTYTPGRILTLSSDDDRLEAYGKDLVHEQKAGRTTLEGEPLYAVRENEPRADKKAAGRNVLTAGAPGRPAFLVIEPGAEPPPTPADPKPKRPSVTTVRGPGRFELYDPASKANTTHVTWQTSFTHAKEQLDARPIDVLTLTDAAAFEDTRSDYWLRGRVLKLWLDAPEAKDGRPDGGQPRPHRLQAIGEVTAHSADFDIDRADHFTALFRDVPPPKEGPKPQTAEPRSAPEAHAPGSPAPPSAPGAHAPGSPGPEKTEEPKKKAKPPMRLAARVIDTWVVRYPVTRPAAAKPEPKKGEPAPAAAADAAPETGTKYELERARCEGGVVVHQDPAEADKARGLDIVGNLLLVEHTPNGGVLTVFGTDTVPGEVHHDEMSMLGPKVMIDQLRNRAAVEGRGALVMPAGSNLTGGDLPADGAAAAEEKKPRGKVVVHWREEMTFDGSSRRAEFIGRVQATQDESSVRCHTLQVIFDRPVSFNRVPRPAEPAAGPDPKGGRPVPKADDDPNKPKVQTVYCYPAPEDAPDEPKGAQVVTYHEVVRGKDGVRAKEQLVTARELVMQALPAGPGRARAAQQVTADGPGVVRIWQPGKKDEVGPAAGAAAAQPGPAESEMKLTVVQFGGRMTLVDEKVLQTATFQDTVEVLHVPSDDPAATVSPHRLPVGAVWLKCADRLVVTTEHPPKPPGAKTAPPAVQRLVATGNADIRSDEYDGWGETVTSDGRYVTLDGGAKAARVIKRAGGDTIPGQRIVYDRLTGGLQIVDARGGSIRGTGNR